MDWMNLWTSNSTLIKCFLYKSCLGHGVCSLQLKMTKTEVGTRDMDIAVIGFCLEECTFWDFEFAKQWNTLCGGLMGYPRRNMEDLVTESVWTEQIWPKILQRRWISVCDLEAVFMVFWWRIWLLFPCVKSLLEAKVKIFELIAQMREVSTEVSRDIFSG